ncbi:entericidin A/B family lipoprotein [Cognatilysobacter bugurensis]|uniref:Entericidin A n=1 Tax=Cognatilysobacter bugurensis TaxID=543356 RepID=A0A918T4B2_9GAMM|nr:entericidin A/B family lipoprotein [Lysobacter bugurensis]GHA86118.1 entericidin A [Lysobacter bugurensis]
MKRVIGMMFVALLSMGTLTACNTMAGLGEDVQQAGDALQDEAIACKEGERLVGEECIADQID